MAIALEDFIRNHRRQHVTERLNAVYGDPAQQRAPDAADASLETWRTLTADDTW